MASHLHYYVNPADIQRIVFGQNPSYYVTVFGGGQGLNFFQGVHAQRGSGFLADIFKDYVLPVVRKAAPHLFRGVAGVVSDVSKGQDVKKSIKRRGVKALRKTARSLLTGQGRKRRKVRRKKKRKLVKRRKKTVNKKTRKRKKKNTTKRSKRKKAMFPLLS